MHLKRLLLSIVLSLVFVCPARAALNLDRLADADIQHVKDLIVRLDPLIKAREKKKDLARLTFDELYAPLNKEDQKFLKQFEHLSAKKLHVKIPYRQIATGKESLTLITGQMVKNREKNKMEELPPQFLPPNVYEAYTKMMDAMQKDIGKRLYVESGYRSSAYQLYLFVYYLQNHEYSIRETVKYVALPGYSEHGAPQYQALDFINVDGINGDNGKAEEFEALPENKWLLENAYKFNFVLSYPKNAAVGITWEPWHWRYENLECGL